jgi:hypothetical protein
MNWEDFTTQLCPQSAWGTTADNPSSTSYTQVQTKDYYEEDTFQYHMKASYDFTLYGFHRVSIAGYSNLSLLKQSNYCVGWRSDIVTGPSTEIVLGAKQIYYMFGEEAIKSEYALLASLMQVGTLYKLATELSGSKVSGEKTETSGTTIVTDAVNTYCAGYRTVKDGVKSSMKAAYNAVIASKTEATETSTVTGTVHTIVAGEVSYI